MQIALPVVGQIGRRIARGLDEPTMELVQLRDQQLRGYRVRDDSMAPVFRPGQLALTLSGTGGAPAAAGARCAGRAPGRQGPAAATLPSSDPDHGTSLPTTHLLPMVAVQEARSIVGILWPEAWRETGAMELPRAYPLQLMRNSRFAGSLKNAVYFSQLWVIGKPAGRSRPCRPRE